MKYEIQNANPGYDDKGDPLPPHPRAVREAVPNWDYRTFRSVAEYNFSPYNKLRWDEEGDLHSTWDYEGSPAICRRLGTRTEWIIDIPDLHEFLREVGDFHLTAGEIHPDGSSSYPEILIGACH